MAEVTVDVAGRAYRLGCGEGEEAHLMSLAEAIDYEARGLTRQFGHMPEGRLLLMTALMIADRLGDAEESMREMEDRLAKAEKLADRRREPADMFGAERDEQLARRLTMLAERIESFAFSDGR